MISSKERIPKEQYAKLVEVEQDEESQPQTTKQLKESSDMEGPLPFPAHCDDDSLLLVGMTFEAVVARSA
jgi:hypothetical protein